MLRLLALLSLSLSLLAGSVCALLGPLGATPATGCVTDGCLLRLKPIVLDEIFFLHMQKTGGSSLDQILTAYSYRHGIPIYAPETLTVNIPPKNETNLVITIFREPVNRVVSNFKQHLYMNSIAKSHSAGGCGRHAVRMGMAAYIKTCPEETANMMTKYMTANKISDVEDTFHIHALHEDYDGLIMILHLQYGFSVAEMLALDLRKTQNKTFGNVKTENLQLIHTLNQKDLLLYGKAEFLWHLMMSDIYGYLNMNYDLVQQMLNEYRALRSHYLQFSLLEPLCQLGPVKYAARTGPDPVSSLQVFKKRNNVKEAVEKVLACRDAFCRIDGRCAQNTLLYNFREKKEKI
jgi:hypothetical protein